MAKFNKPQIQIGRSDYKKAILNANKRLEKKNSNLKLQIKEFESRLTELDSKEKITFNRIKKVQDRLDSDEAQAHSVAQTLNGYNQKLSNSKSTYAKVQSEELTASKEVEKLKEESIKLSENISFLEIKKNVYSNLKGDFSSIKIEVKRDIKH